MKVIYVAGPYRAKTAWERQRNIQEAAIVAAEVWNQGNCAICPQMNSANFDGAADDQVFLDGYVEILRRCDELWLVSGWERSQGTMMEIKEAHRNNIPVIDFTTGEIIKPPWGEDYRVYLRHVLGLDSEPAKTYFVALASAASAFEEENSIVVLDELGRA